jgi:hypothetical protein
MAVVRRETAVRFFISLNVGLLGSAGVIAVGCGLDPATFQTVFGLANWATNALGDWLGWDSYERARDVLGLAFQHLVLSLIMALACLWALSRLRVEESQVRRAGWFLAASAPWLMLGVVVEPPLSFMEAVMSYGWMVLCLAITLRAAWLASKSWPHLRVEAIVALLTAIASWLFVTSFIGPVEKIAAYSAALAAVGLAASAMDEPFVGSLPQT